MLKSYIFIYGVRSLLQLKRKCYLTHLYFYIWRFGIFGFWCDRDDKQEGNGKSR
uniref:Uncharacterized protein n=1 Tax=Uncultured archaeon GZfos26G2 TaxID=3386331 RepID=Q649J5_UNCAG|nr:hypothetical protein GZ35A2_7 [uncultured archaeon GZfos35A2]